METVLSIIKWFPWVYLGGISLVSVAVCCADKRRSKIEGKRRVPERTLLWLSAFGGSVAMLVTMLLIRHKTKHPKFMIGIPLIIAAQYALFWLIKTYVMKI